MSPVTVSVVIPCFNHNDCVWDAVASCFEGELPDELQVIVVDDGSDVPLRIPPAFHERPVELIRQDNAGLSAARNAGVAAAVGQYLKFLDADDQLIPGMLAAQARSLPADASALSIGGYHLVDRGRSVIRVTMPKFGRLDAALCRINVAPPLAFLFPTEIVRAAGGFVAGERLRGGHEDYELLCRLARQGVRAVSFHDYVARYFKNPGSMSDQPLPMERTRLDVWLEHVRGVLERADVEIFEAALCGLISQAIGVSEQAALTKLRSGWELLRAMSRQPRIVLEETANVGGLGVQLRQWLNWNQPEGAATESVALLGEIYSWIEANVGCRPPLLYAAQELVDPRMLLPALPGHAAWFEFVADWALSNPDARLALYGVCSTAEQLARWLQRIGRSALCVIDSNPAEHGKSCSGVSVVSFDDALELGVDHVVITNNSRYREIRRFILDRRNRTASVDITLVE